MMGLAGPCPGPDKGKGHCRLRTDEGSRETGRAFSLLRSRARCGGGLQNLLVPADLSSVRTRDDGHIFLYTRVFNSSPLFPGLPERYFTDPSERVSKSRDECPHLVSTRPFGTTNIRSILICQQQQQQRQQERPLLCLSGGESLSFEVCSKEL